MVVHDQANKAFTDQASLVSCASGYGSGEYVADIATDSERVGDSSLLASGLKTTKGNQSQKRVLKRRLIPIDHGLSIPDTLAVCSYDLVWLSFAQAERPFSEKSLEYIRSIDFMQDIKMLEETFKFRPQCLRNMRISSTLLKKGAEAGLTLAQIGQILCRPDEDDEQPSLLEEIVQKARMCANMMAQIQTRIKDSTLRLILPSNSLAQNKNPRRYSAADNNLVEKDGKPQVEMLELRGNTKQQEQGLASNDFLAIKYREKNTSRASEYTPRKRKMSW